MRFQAYGLIVGSGLLACAAAFSLLANAAMADRLVPGCRHHQLGNPYTPEQDYMAWSAWRARASWAEPSRPCPPAPHQHRRHSSHAQ